MSRHSRLSSPKTVLGQFLANFQVLGQAVRERRARRGSGPDGPAEGEGTCNTRVRVLILGRVWLTGLPSVPVHIPMDFGSRNEDAAKSWQFPKHLAANESSDGLFADAQCGCGFTDV